MAKKQAHHAQQAHQPLDAPYASQRAPVTERVNVEPSILNGMTMSEAQWIAMGSGAVFLVLGMLVFAATGFWQAILMLTIFGPAVTVWLASNQLLRIKRGRPDGYYTQAIHLWMVRTGLVQSKFIMHHGYWDLGRSLDLSFTTKFDMSAVPDDAPQALAAPPAAPSGARTPHPEMAPPRQVPTKAPKEPKEPKVPKEPRMVLNAPATPPFPSSPPVSPTVAKPHFPEPHMVTA